MNRNGWIGVAVGLVAGFAAGYFVADRPALPPPRAAEAPAPALPPALPPGAALPPGTGFGAPPAAPVPHPQQAARILHNEQVVAQDPKNLQAWIELGNDYFDSHQAARSIQAYAKALALDPKNPNVLTDQGVMYRQAGDFPKALANFEKAAKLDPAHAQSQYNIGIVYAEDLKKPEKAIQAWTRLIEANPAAPQAEMARRAIEALRAKRPLG